MALSDIREQIKAILSGVDGIGIVHDYVRWSSDWKKFLDLYKDADGKINGWHITRTATPSKRDNLPTIQRTHTFIFRGIYGLQDDVASEIAFQAVVEKIQDAFDSEYNLGGHALNSGPAQVNIVEPRMFGPVLCHYAKLTLEVIERVRYSA